MSTFMAKPHEVERKWYIIDAEGKKLGRIASEAASILRGKNKPTYTPHVDTGDFVIIINAEKVELSGKKLDQKYYRYHTGHIGGLKEIPYKRLMEEKPEKAMELAIKGMLPKNSLGRKMYTKLKVYRGTEHNHEAQKPELLEI
ncbi:MAG: 50S ribosomal protein L13 [Tissierellales bacterium]|jgi:large subunit ribosomal protein L13|nr:50S ribosomal protein L13 [Tissierellales bacterium]